MMKGDERDTKRGRHLIFKKRLFRLTVIATLGCVSVAATPSRIAFQDMTSFMSGRHLNRWQAFSVPAPADRIDAASIAFAHADAAVVPTSLALTEAGGKIIDIKANSKNVSSPDENRVVRSAKSGRVLTLAPASTLPPRAFSAGSIMERQSLLGNRVVGGSARIQYAFSKITQSTKDAMIVAANFQLSGPPHIPGAKAAINDLMVASLKSSDTETNALGYAEAPEEPRSATLFEKILKEQPQAFIPPIGKNDHAWAATPLPEDAYTEKEQKCLANGIYFEARGESTMGQAAVAQVILNRVRDPAYPKTICGVVYQNKDWRNRCQFSFACDGMQDRVADAASWSRAERVASQVTRGEIWINEIGSATHYHATYVRPRWASAMEEVDKIGRHIFYRTFGN